MLKAAYETGCLEAMKHFKVKTGLATAWDPNAGFGAQVARGIIGHPDVLMREGLKAFKDPTSGFHHNNVWWPQGPSPGKWLGRAGTVMSALPVASAVLGGGDPREGRLTNMLSAAGGAVGSAYGFPAGGLLGGSLLGAAGSHLGKGLGHLLGSKPRPQAPAQAPQQLNPYSATPGGF